MGKKIREGASLPNGAAKFEGSKKKKLTRQPVLTCSLANLAQRNTTQRFFPFRLHTLFFPLHHAKSDSCQI